MRLFVAVGFSPAVRRALVQSIETLRAQAVRGNFTKPENLHLTLAFLGELPAPDGAAAALETVSAAPFPLTLSGGGRFGDLWWLGADGGAALTSLAASVRRALRAARVPFDPKPFRPHITLCRALVPRGEVTPPVPRAEMTVSRVSLMRSARIGGRLVYTELYARTLTEEETP